MAQVTDYSIANGTGSAVRTDLNNVFAAIQSLNSGSQQILVVHRLRSNYQLIQHLIFLLKNKKCS